MKEGAYVLLVGLLLIVAVSGCRGSRESSPAALDQPSAPGAIPPENEPDAAQLDTPLFEKEIEVVQDIDVDTIDLRSIIDPGRANPEKDTDSHYTLGMMYYRGEGVPQDYRMAAKWLRKAADQGNQEAQCRLGLMYYSGLGVPKNVSETINWLTQAAELGHAKAQYNLGVLYDIGDGVPKNKAEAVNWYEKASEQGFTRAQFNLGRLYLLDEGNKQNTLMGFNWLKKSANGNNAQAQAQLARCYYAGVGVLLDYVEAYKWASLAAMNGEHIEMKAEIKKALSQTQIEEALRRVGEFVDKLGAAE